MKALALTSKGIEDITALEIRELIGVEGEIIDGGVVFDFNDFKELFLLCYKAQSVTKIAYLLHSFKSGKNPLKTFEGEIEKLNLKEWLSDTFSVEVIRIGSHDFNSADVIKSAIKLIQKKAKLDFKTPETTFFIYITDDNFYFGIDFSGKDLSRRDYRIFLGNEELKANIAYAILRIADFKANEVLLDPFCRAGVIPIEAVLFASDFSHNYYDKNKFLFLKLDKFKDFNFDKFFNNEDKKIKKIKLDINAIDPSFNNITAAKKNAKIAGAVKSINFSRTDFEWLDTKFKKAGVDKIISMPPQLSKRKDIKEVEKVYKGLFHQAEFIMRRDGLMLLVSKQGNELLKKKAEENRFKLKHERIVMQGKEELKISMFGLQ